MQKANVLEFYSPLHEFQYTGSDFELAPKIWIRKKKGTIPARAITSDKSKRLELEDNWLWLDCDEDASSSASTRINLSLLSLRLVKPSKVFVAYRLCEKIEYCSEFLERFSSPQGTPRSEFTDVDLRKAATYYQHLSKICDKKGRLYNALSLMTAGIRSSNWSVSLICHASALETMLTYSDKPKLTARLSKTYACLMAATDLERDKLYEDFKSAYSARSDVTHGRMHNINSDQRVPALINIQDITRAVWQKIFSCSRLMAVLEEDDIARESYLKALCGNYKRIKESK